MSQVVLITGAESGIGKATALAFAEAGYDVGFTWFSSEVASERLTADVTALGARVACCRLDLTVPETGVAAIEDLAGQLGGLDVFVNNAATPYSSSFLDMPVAAWQQVLNVNLTGPFCCAQTAVRLMMMQERRGCVVNVTSIQDTYPVANSSAYGAAKGGLRQLTRVMAVELGRHGIRVNAVAPGEINTAMTHREGVSGEEVPRPALPMGRAGSASEVASAIVWLASDAASYMTGATLVIDGGAIMMGPQLAAVSEPYELEAREENDLGQNATASPPDDNGHSG